MEINYASPRVVVEWPEKKPTDLRPWEDVIATVYGRQFGRVRMRGERPWEHGA